MSSARADQSFGVYTTGMREAFYLLKGLTNEQRGLILCWFCKGCDRYVGPGDDCQCWNDE